MPKPVILCVDDEVVILDSLKIQLRAAFQDQYTYELAENVDEAWEILEELQEEDVDILVIVSDWLMPGTKGDEFLINVHHTFPQVLKIMLTGQANRDAIERAVNEANLYRCLHKPWSRDELISTIQSGLKNHV